MVKLISELKRRNVFRVAGVYAVVGWLLMQLAGTLESSLKLPDWFDGVITASLLIGFPIALLLAWAFEMTPEGVKRTEGSEVVESELISGNKMDGFILLGIVAIIGLGIWQQLTHEDMDSRVRENDKVVVDKNSIISNNNPDIHNNKSVIPAQAGISTKEQEIKPNSIAVLPFSDLSQDGDQEYFSDGMAEEILNVLVRVSALQVTSRTSAFRYKNSDLRIPEIAEELKVRHVLEGSVRKSGETLRITAQLIDAQNDKHLWSETYDRPLTTNNIFAIQDEISNAILLALGDRLDLPSKIEIRQSTSNLTAYELYLKAKPLYFARLDLDVADKLLEQATNLDPNFAKAWEIRAALQMLMGYYNYSDMTVEQQSEKLFEYADIAIAIEPNSAIAIASKALMKTDEIFRLETEIDLSQNLADYNKALKIDPQNASAHNWKGLLLHYSGFLEKAMDSFLSCLEYEPFYAPCSENMEIVLAEIGRDKEAIDLYLSSLNRGNRNISGSHPLAAMARLDMEILFKTLTNHKALLYGWLKHDELYQAYKNPNGDHSELIKEAEEYMKDNNSVIQDIDIMLNPLGRIPENIMLGIWDATNQKGRQSFEFKYLIKKSGIYNFWLEIGFPPQCRPIGEDDFECE